MHALAAMPAYHHSNNFDIPVAGYKSTMPPMWRRTTHLQHLKPHNALGGDQDLGDHGRRHHGVELSRQGMTAGPQPHDQLEGLGLDGLAAGLLHDLLRKMAAL